MNGTKNISLKNNIHMKRNIPLAIPELLGNEKKYLNECIDTGFVSSVGPFVDKFEKMLCEETGAAHAVAVASGTCALNTALVVAGVKPGDLVIIPAFTFIATANAVSHCGANPWIIDISNKDWGLDPDLLGEIFRTQTYRKTEGLFHKTSHQKISAVVPVYSLGLPCEMNALRLICNEFQLPLVVDAAAGIGATYHSQPLGLHGGDFTILSFNGNKNITTGGGGAVLSNDANLAKKVRHISTTARIGPDYDHDEVGYNYRMTNLEAAVGCAQLERLTKITERKKSIQEFYQNAFCEISEIQFFPELEDRSGSYWLSGIILNNGKLEPLMQHLRSLDVESKWFWKPIHHQKPYKNCIRTNTKNSDYLWDKILVLPSSTAITDSELETVVSGVFNFFKR